MIASNYPKKLLRKLLYNFHLSIFAKDQLKYVIFVRTLDISLVAIPTFVQGAMVNIVKKHVSWARANQPASFVFQGTQKKI